MLRRMKTEKAIRIQRKIQRNPITGLLHLHTNQNKFSNSNQYPCKVERPVKTNSNYSFTRFG
ncbi:hypothetical protein FGIG_05977 [Fasciola gigantica]|uniref:Uncharacterized protein n=1 Tax=Fasciola gigantica TaxID=46835 RepID=A0A504YM15_FASGI|nr:hypothetical protein FGIG_05977 [Fasciola gigantica]